MRNEGSSPSDGSSAGRLRCSTLTSLRDGQKPARPATASSAGSSVRDAASPTTMPVAFTGPKIWIELVRATSSVSSAPATTKPLAAIAGPARTSARLIALCLSSTSRNSLE